MTSPTPYYKAEPVNVKSEQLDTAMVDVHTHPGGTPIKQCTHTIFIWYNQLNGGQESLHGAINDLVDQLRAERL